jgi:hypothetical protein
MHDRVRLMTSGNPDEFRSCLPEDMNVLPKPGSFAFAKIGKQWKRFSVNKYCLIRELTYLGVSATVLNMHALTSNCNADDSAECCAAVHCVIDV